MGIETHDRQPAVRTEHRHRILAHNPLRCAHPITPESPMSTSMTIRLEDEVKDRLDRLADAAQRSK